MSAEKIASLQLEAGKLVGEMQNIEQNIQLLINKHTTTKQQLNRVLTDLNNQGAKPENEVLLYLRNTSFYALISEFAGTLK